MKQTIKLTQKAEIPDETYAGEPPVPSATNYQGAVLTVGRALAERLIAEGKAVAHEPNTPPESGTRPGADTPSAPGAGIAASVED